MDLISAIVPVYNVEKYLYRCVDSILKQTYENFELILIDDGSPDNCSQMCDELSEKDSRIKVIHQENQGLSAARNSGIKIAKGNYLTFIDSDDWISNTMFEDLINLIKEKNADISICNFIVTDGNAIYKKNTKAEEKLYSKDEFMKIILRVNSNRCIHYAWGKLYKKDVIDKNEHYPVGMLNEDVEGMFKAVLKSEKIAETNKIGYFYYENSESISRKKFGENFLSLHHVWERILEISQNSAPEYVDYVKYNLIRSDFTILVDMILYGDKETDNIFSIERKNIKKRLKTNIGILLKSPMQIKRKILMLLVCYFYLPIRFMVRTIKNRK